MPKNSNKGFTLVELLVVISIIAILSVIGITIFSGVQKNARDAKRRGDLHAIDKALELYKADNGKYPQSATFTGAISCEPNWDCGDGRAECLKTFLVPKYMLDLPRDPQQTSNTDCGNGWYGTSGHGFYKYHPNADGSSFQAAASLENKPGTGDFTNGCIPADCIFNKAKGGYGFNNQQ